MEEQVVARIKNLRQQQGYTIAEFATKLGFNSHTAYAKIEYGKTEIKLRHLLKICEEFDVTLPWLLGMETQASNSSQNELRNLESLHYRLTSYFEFAHVLKLALIQAIDAKEQDKAKVSLTEIENEFHKYVGFDINAQPVNVPYLKVKNGTFLMGNGITDIVMFLGQDINSTLSWVSDLIKERKPSLNPKG